MFCRPSCLVDCGALLVRLSCCLVLHIAGRLSWLLDQHVAGFSPLHSTILYVHGSGRLNRLLLLMPRHKRCCGLFTTCCYCTFLPLFLAPVVSLASGNVADIQRMEGVKFRLTATSLQGLQFVFPRVMYSNAPSTLSQQRTAQAATTPPPTVQPTTSSQPMPITNRRYL